MSGRLEEQTVTALAHGHRSDVVRKLGVKECRSIVSLNYHNVAV
jgi:hypothetical protein